jgi:Fungal Zn(2)-Cys(6) binuclear cluster domain
MSISYSSPLGGNMDQNLPKAPQACMSCRKQKRKCNKGLPACSLCERMGRLCDYSDASPAPTSDDFNALRQKLLELERRLNGSNGPNGIENTPYLPTPSASTVSGTADSVGATPGTVYLQQDPAYQNVQNRFPGIAFLDSEAFKYGQIVVPKPSVDIPVVSILLSFILLNLFSFQCVWHTSSTQPYERCLRPYYPSAPIQSLPACPACRISWFKSWAARNYCSLSLHF